MRAIPGVSEEWMMAEMKERREKRQDLTRAVGRGSSSQEDLDLRMGTEISGGSGNWQVEEG